MKELEITQSNDLTNGIQFLISNGIDVSKDGTILSKLPDGIDGVSLSDDLESVAAPDGYFFAIILNSLRLLEL
jgi:hypothetical protein